ncbi:MAG TPA: hypothetical protein VGP83_06480 [Pyrinomonadaceae bacterium]|nr:hypothetical protein [Pyrinomonadaceae bacterium]
MEKQTLTFTALPNGFAPDGSPRVSVFISQRLWSDTAGAGNTTLDKYPDQINWPARVAALTWEASINGGPAIPLTEPLSELDPALWSALFHDTTQVKPFAFEDFRGMPIESFPTFAIHDMIRGVYGRASSDPAYGEGKNRPGLDVLAADTDLIAIARPTLPDPEPPWNPVETAATPFPDAPPVKEKPEPGPDLPPPEPIEKGCGCGCLAWPLEILRRILGLPKKDAKGGAAPVYDVPPSTPAATPSFKTDVTPPPPPAPPTPPKSFLPPPLSAAQLQTQAAFDSLDAFLKPFAGAEPKLPTAAQLAATWDFHQAISSLGDYPKMLRRLGLVLDLVMPAGTVIPANGTIEVTGKNVVFQAGTTLVSPRTRFVSAPNLFTAAPRPVQPEITNGFLRVDDTLRFRVIQNDVVGDATKLRNAATFALRFALAADRPGNVPGDSGLPALRTVGISLVKNEVTTELSDQFLRSCALNLFVASKDLSPLPPPVAPGGAPPALSDELFAEDLVRGYRIDVFDTKTGVWRSLCERQGTYRFLEAAGGPRNETADDEGFVQFAATEPRDPAAPKSLRAGETLFTWNGWSLAAPRPGKAIMPDDTHADPGNAAVTPFKIETTFKARPASLPRLRFGRQYRLRARVADLAGNSVTNPDDASYNDDVPQKTDEFTALRYEPLAPPILMLRSAPVEGESVERLVLRKPALGGLGASTVRHVAPPKTSQLMAEWHGGFDNGVVDGSATGYALASRESNSVNDGAQQTKPALDGAPGVIPAVPIESDPWIQTAPLVTVNYLPDPQARGVAFFDLPGDTSPDRIFVVTFANAWPDLKPFRIELVPIGVGAISGPPTFAADTLKVELAPSQRATVRINSLMDPGDLDKRGVWQWTDELAPPNLAQVRTSVIKGRHWAHLPWRDITLVYATQKPVEPPEIQTLNPAKSLGQTFAVVDGKIKVHSASTARIQLLANWTDPIDDPATDPPAGLPVVPTFQTQNSHVCETEVPETVSPVDIRDSGTRTNPKHEFNDTKYHRVTYTPVGTTRFREYFPPSTNTPPNTTEAGPGFGVDVLNSARPDMPKYLYTVPVFEWDTPPGTPGIVKRQRTGGGIRIYLDRPWFSSGDGELLGVVFQEGTNFLTMDVAFRRFVTIWGADPIWHANPAPDQAQKINFKNVVTDESGKLLQEDSKADVTVVGYAVNFDAERRLWFADISIDTGNAYWPFVRLALARFQPKSIKDAFISQIVRADFIQLPPDRLAEITVGGASVHLKVTGPTYFRSEVVETVKDFPFFSGSPTSNGLSEIEAVIEERNATDDPGNELSWKPIDATRTLLIQNPAKPGEWEGDVPFATLAPGLMRLTLKEFEWYRTDDAISQDAPRTQIRVARRLVYADVFAL